MSKTHLVSLFFLLSFSLSAIGQDEGFLQATGNVRSNENLTDAEQQTKETFIHSGLSQRTLDDLCNDTNKYGKDIKDACAGSQVDTWGISPDMAHAVQKAYAMIVGMSGGKYDAKVYNTDGGGATTGGSTEGGGQIGQNQANGQANQEGNDTEEREDYCRYVAIATETVSTFMQQMAQSQLDEEDGINEGQSEQVDKLFKAQRSHIKRAEGAEFQAAGWGVTTGCYAAELISGGYIDPMLYVKFAASGLFTAYAISEASNNRHYARMLGEIIKKMPDSGDCNPITENACYCAQPETELDPQHCKANVIAAARGSNKIQAACTDGQLKVDANCACLQTNTCFSTTFASNIGGTTFGTSLEEVVGTEAQDLFNGQLTGGTNLRDGSLSGRAAARNKKLLNKLKSKFQFPELNKKQKDTALGLNKQFGIPKEIAGVLAHVPAPADTGKFADKVNAKGKGRTIAYNQFGKKNDNNKVLTFSGGDFGNNRAAAPSSNSFDFNKLLNKGKKDPKRHGQKILNFAQKAQDKAARSAIHDRPGVSIFQIISRRYQITGSQRLE